VGLSDRLADLEGRISKAEKGQSAIKDFIRVEIGPQGSILREKAVADARASGAGAGGDAASDERLLTTLISAMQRHTGDYSFSQLASETAATREFLAMGTKAALEAATLEAGSSTVPLANASATATVKVGGADEEDEEWSDDAAEVRSLRLIPADRPKLRALEDSLPTPTRKVAHAVVGRIDPLSRENSRALLDAASTYLPSHPSPYAILSSGVRRLVAMGANVLFVPPGASGQSDSDARWRFALRYDDSIRPVDATGLGLSQVAYLAFQGMMRHLGQEKRVELPHGAVRGFDPWPEVDGSAAAAGRDSLAASFASPYSLALAGSKDDSFPHADASWKAVFGTDRAPRFAHATSAKLRHGITFDASGNPQVQRTIQRDRAKLRDYFDTYYYDVSGYSGRRVVFVVFADALSTFLARLLEVAGGGGPTLLQKVVIVALPWEFMQQTVVSGRLFDLQSRAKGRMKGGASPEAAYNSLLLDAYRDISRVFRPQLEHHL
jgi:hypothetical protein